MKISAGGLENLKQREGCELKSYQDSGGVWTIGVGSTYYMNGAKVGPNQTITEHEALELLAHTLKHYEDIVNTNLKVNVSQDVFDDLVSLAYNTESGARNHIKRINAGKYA